MLKKSLMFFSVLFLAGALLIGCSSPTGPAGPAGEAGPPGAGTGTGSGGGGEQAGGGPVNISGELPTSVIQGMINEATGTIYITGLTQGDEGTILIPANKSVVLTNTSAPAPAITLATNGILIVQSAASLTGDGEITGAADTEKIIAEKSILTDGKNSRIASGSSATEVPFLDGDETDDALKAMENFAVNGNATINADGTGGVTFIKAGNIKADANIYVVGDLTVSEAVTTTGGLNVTGAVTAGAVITAPLTAGGAVNFTAQQTGPITSLSAGSITSGVDVEVTGAIAANSLTLTGGTLAGGSTVAITGNVNIADSAELEGTGAVTISGTANITGTLTGGDDVTISGATTVNGELTAVDALAVGPLTIGGSGTLGATSTVAITGDADIAGSFEAGGNVTTSGNITVTGTGSIEIEDVSLTMLAGKVLNIADAGASVALAGTASVVLTGASGTGGAKLTGAGKLTAGATEIVGGINGGWQAVDGSASATITIAAASAITASITASAGTVKLTAAGAGATITQLGGDNGNSLSIAAATTIALGGDGVAVGSIILGSHASDSGKLILTTQDTSLVTTGATSANTTVTGTFDTPPVASQTTLSWKAEVDETGGKWSELKASSNNGALVGGSAGFTLSGAVAIEAHS